MIYYDSANNFTKCLLCDSKGQMCNCKVLILYIRENSIYHLNNITQNVLLQTEIIQNIKDHYPYASKFIFAIYKKKLISFFNDNDFR